MVGSTAYTVVGTTSIFGTGWRHLAATKNSSGIYLYLDGKLIASDTTATANFNAGTGMAIGMMSDERIISGRMYGNIDEAKLYYYPLTQSQVAIDMNNGSAVSLGRTNWTQYSSTKNPATAISDGGGGGAAWSSPTNVYLGDGTTAVANVSNLSTTSDFLKATNYSFNIPSNARIDAVTAYVKAAKLPTQFSTITAFSLVKNSTRLAPESPGITLTGTLTYFSYTFTNSKYNLTPADVNSSGFGVHHS
jgi:hypothetical protein